MLAFRPKGFSMPEAGERIRTYAAAGARAAGAVVLASAGVARAIERKLLVANLMSALLRKEKEGIIDLVVER